MHPPPVQLHHLVADMARRQPHAPAVTAGGTSLRYAELWDEVVTVARGLREAGVSRGDRVAVYLDKRLETVVGSFAVPAAAGVLVPINPLLRPAQVRHILADCGVRVLITSAQRLGQLGEVMTMLAAPPEVVLVNDPAAPAPAAGPSRPWPKVAPQGNSGFEDPAVVEQDMAAIFYTSGSSGQPKGVVVSHRNLLAGAQSVNAYLGNGPQDTLLAVLPLSFDAGFSQLTSAFAVGAQVVLLDYHFPADVVSLCVRHRVTGITGVPPLWVQLARHRWPAGAGQSLRYFATTGGRLSQSTLDRLRTLFPDARPFLMYGLTEAFRSTYLEPSEVGRRPDSIGKAVPNAEVMVVRPDGSPCRPGEEGELVHRGATVALGYWNDPVGTARRFRPAPGSPGGLSAAPAVWSGDRVVSDDDGFLYFVGRADDMIKVSGYRISPTEVEDAVLATGLVGEAVALGVDTPDGDQSIALVVTTATGSAVDRAALLAMLRRRMPRYMLPRQIITRAEIPRSHNGKYDRRTLRKELGG
ncbi:acyl-CoA ligase (AMP-forming), exosortase A system-associated [Micromonospora okii]|uniref:acyl-CoA ligase (AMP-forming), exosortase A system-associated n=1 Tax=Micromonospora okii TaxID=1182970 RepID=UPI001E32EE0C|nr:acyl-CoA ligase (AMP-forming), exosortase A system-associated [Micromonospora okii]